MTCKKMSWLLSTHLRPTLPLLLLAVFFLHSFVARELAALPSQLAQAQAAQLPGDGSLSHLHNPGAAALGVPQNQKHHDGGGAGGNHPRDPRQHPPHPSHQGQHGGRGGGDHQRVHHAGQQQQQQHHERGQRGEDHRMAEHAHQAGQQRSRGGGGPAGGAVDRRGGPGAQQQQQPFTQHGELFGGSGVGLLSWAVVGVVVVLVCGGGCGYWR